MRRLRKLNEKYLETLSTTVKRLPKRNLTTAGELGGNKEPYSMLVREQIHTDIMKTSLKISQKGKSGINI